MKNAKPSKVSCLGADKTRIEFSVCSIGPVYSLTAGESFAIAFRKGFHTLDLAIEMVYGKDLYSYTSRVQKGCTGFSSGKVRSKKAEKIYEMAMKAIKSGRLKAREVDQRDSKQEEIPGTVFSDGEVWYSNFNFHGMEVPIEDFLAWALSERVPISDMFYPGARIQQALPREIPPQKVCSASNRSSRLVLRTVAHHKVGEAPVISRNV